MYMYMGIDSWKIGTAMCNGCRAGSRFKWILNSPFWQNNMRGEHEAKSIDHVIQKKQKGSLTEIIN